MIASDRIDRSPFRTLFLLRVLNRAASPQFTSEGELVVHRVAVGQVPTEVYFELEKRNPDDDIVLVKADTFDEIRSAYRNYFSDTVEFLRIVHEGLIQLNRPEKVRARRRKGTFPTS